MITVNGVPIDKTSFPNGETKIEVKYINMLDKNVIGFRYENDADLLHLLFVKMHLDTMAIDHNMPMKNILFIYYMPYSRQDRAKNGSLFSLKYICKIINMLKFDKVVVFEPHSDVTPALLENATQYSLTKQVTKTAMMEIDFNTEHDYVCFPDAGAQKRYADTIKSKHQLVCFKHRNFDTGKIEQLQLVGNYRKGGRVIIVDDLCSYGGTFLLTAEALKDLGAEEIYLAVGHCENSVLKGKMIESNAIKKIFTSNTILDAASIPDNIKDRFNVAEVL